MYLSGRVACITGAASGIGRGAALALARAGANVAVGTLMTEDHAGLTVGQTADLLSPEDISSLKFEIEGYGVSSYCDRLDVSSDASVENFFTAIEAALGPVDILVNSAYAGAKHLLTDHPSLLWEALVNTNLNGAFRTTRRCLPGMIERRWGRIINIASTAASVGFAGSAAYCASKAALLGLTRCAALEGAAHGVSCNAVSPGWVNSRQSREVYQKQLALSGSQKSLYEFMAEAADAIPQKRLLEPIEVGAFIAFLCHDQAFGITGEDLRISAGSLW